MTLLDFQTNDSYLWEVANPEPTACSSDMQIVGAPYDRGTMGESLGMTTHIAITYVQSGVRRFMLRKELRPDLIREGSLWSCELDELHLMGYAPTHQEAIQAFMDDFAATYDGLADEADDDLTLDARDLRDAIVGLVATVVPLDEPSMLVLYLPIKRRSPSVVKAWDPITVSVASVL